MLHRTNIYLEDRTIQSLKLLAAARGKSMSDLVRDAVESMLASPIEGVDWRAEVSDVLGGSKARDLPELSAEEIIAEVRAGREESRGGSRR